MVSGERMGRRLTRFVLLIPICFFVLRDVRCHGEVITFDNGLTNIVDSDLSLNYIEVFDNDLAGPTTVVINQGAVIGSEPTLDNSVVVYDSSRMEILGGLLLRDAVAQDSALINVRAGAIGDDLQSLDSATINLFGGTIGDEVQSNGTSTINVHGGMIGDDLEAYDSSTINIRGGVAGEDVEAFDTSNIFVFGGLLGQGALVTRGIGALDQSSITVIGSNFQVDGISTTGPITELSGTLTGILSDGTTLNTPFVQDTAGQIKLSAVPEPSGTLLLALTALAIASRRNKDPLPLF